MKKRLVATTSIILAFFILGYLFILGLLMGFLASKFLSGKTTGQRGKLGSVLIPFRRWKLHLHHWLYSSWLAGISTVTGIYFLAPLLTYGLLGGVAFQGIYCYDDWHIILVDRHPNALKQAYQASQELVRG